ncbi:MAG: M1 family peptidase, partial [Flavisolibacter sp.]|nr:M1 family peptidase [Flavisolibacter sp.]
YARRWAFKYPTPADFFRTMEDASAEDLDWFWRGWFFSTDACDISLDSVKEVRVDADASKKVQIQNRTELQSMPKPQLNEFEDISKIRNREDKSIRFESDVDTTLRDFYWRYARGLEPYDTAKYNVPVTASVEPLSETKLQQFANKHFYELTFSNKGGLVMPIIIQWTYKDGTKEIDHIPAQIWRLNENKVTKAFMKDKEVASIQIDPYKETADIDETNNTWGTITPAPTRFQVFKQKQAGVRGQSTGINPMQKAQEKRGF